MTNLLQEPENPTGKAFASFGTTSDVPVPAGLTIKMPPRQPAVKPLATNPKPFFDISYKSVPEKMRKEKRWLAFQITWNPDKNKFDKRPVNFEGKPTNDPTKGDSFETMLAFVNKHQGYILGFYIENPYALIDADNCRDRKTGIIADWAEKIKRDATSYQEFSIGGEGFHIIAEAKKPGDYCRRGSLEIYTTNRAVAISGMHIPGTPGTVNKCDITGIYSQMEAGAYVFGKAQLGAKSGASGQSTQIQSNGIIVTNKLILLSTGTFTPNSLPFIVSDDYNNAVQYDSQSEAIGALLACLAIKTDCDPEKIREGYFQSGLSQIPKWRDHKWAERGDKEISRAIEFVRSKSHTKTTTLATPIEQQSEDTRATSLLIFATAKDAARAAELGFNSVVVSDFKPPLDSAYSRVILFGKSTDERFRNIFVAIPGMGAIYAPLPRDKSKPRLNYHGQNIGAGADNLTDVPTDVAANYLNSLLTSQAIEYATVKKPKTVLVEVPADNVRLITDACVIDDGTFVFNTSNIPSFNPNVMKDSIFEGFVNLVTNGTTLAPQFAYQIGRVFFSALLAGRVKFDLLAGVVPLRRLVMLGETGSGKGESYRRSEYVITYGATQRDKVIKIAHGVDSGAGLKDMFWDDPIGLPVLLYFDEVTTLGHKASDKKNPEILDALGELADNTNISRVLAKRGRSKEKASKTLNDAYLSTIMCSPDGLTFMCATAGRKTAGFNDRQIPVYGSPVEAGALPEIPMRAIINWWAEADQLLAQVGTKPNPGTAVMSPEAKAALDTFWQGQPQAIRTKVRFKKYLLLDAYLNAIGRGRMMVSAKDATDAIEDCRRELITRAACFQEEVNDRVGYYFAAIKRFTAEIAAKIQKAGPSADLFAYGMSESDFERETRAYANNEPEQFTRAWKCWMPRHLEKLEARAAKNGKSVTRYIPARSERD